MTQTRCSKVLMLYLLFYWLGVWIFVVLLDFRPPMVLLNAVSDFQNWFLFLVCLYCWKSNNDSSMDRFFFQIFFSCIPLKILADGQILIYVAWSWSMLLISYSWSCVAINGNIYVAKWSLSCLISIDEVKYVVKTCCSYMLFKFICY